MTLPFPLSTQAELVKRVVDVDKPLRPTEVKRELRVEGLDLIMCVFLVLVLLQLHPHCLAFLLLSHPTSLCDLIHSITVNSKLVPSPKLV